MEKNLKISYHATDADADVVAGIIVKAADEAIERFSTPEAFIPKGFVDYMERTGDSYIQCCSANLNVVLGDEMNGGLDDTFIKPYAEGGWGDIKEMSLEDYVERISDAAKNNIASSGFINCWLQDLEEHDLSGLAELMIKVNMRLVRNESVQYFQIREEVIERTFYYLRRMAFED